MPAKIVCRLLQISCNANDSLADELRTLTFLEQILNCLKLMGGRT